jgi:hypothetical protein
MKKHIRVIRSENQTIVIYREPPKGKEAPPAMRQKPILVRILGRRHHYIMPDGSILPIRESAFWKFIKLIRPQARFAV